VKTFIFAERAVVTPPAGRPWRGLPPDGGGASIGDGVSLARVGKLNELLVKVPVKLLNELPVKVPVKLPGV
jgi:hypothetical protein